MRVKLIRTKEEFVEFVSYEKLILWLKQQAGKWLLNFEPDDEQVEVQVEAVHE
jgi:hypothetical protein